MKAAGIIGTSSGASLPTTLPHPSNDRSAALKSLVEPRESLNFSRWQLTTSATWTILVFIGHLPLLTKFFLDLWTRPQYQFFPITLLTAAYIGWDRAREAARNEFERGSRLVSGGILTLGLILLVIGAFLWLRWLAPVAGCFTLAGIVWGIGGRKLAAALLPVLMLLMLVIPPPLHWDNTLTHGLQTVAVRAASGLLDRLSLPHLISGNVIEVPGRRLMVEEACSGINSLMAVIAFTLAWGFLRRYRPFHLGVLVICAMALVLWANVFRITFATLALVQWHLDLFAGAGHQWFGLLNFIVSLMVLLGVDRFLQAGDNNATKTELHEAQKTVSLLHAATYFNRCSIAGAGRTAFDRSRWLFAFAYLAIGIWTQIRLEHAWADSSLPTNAHFTLPQRLAGWERIEAAEPMLGRAELVGRDSFVWTYRSGKLTAAVAFDYPFIGYHDLSICYLSTGWTVVESRVIHAASLVSPNADTADPNPFVQLRMNKPPILFGFLLFSLCDEKGHWLADRGVIPRGGGHSRLDRVSQLALSPASYQIQVMVQSFAPLEGVEERQVTELFREARRELARQLLQQVNRATK